MSLGTRRARKLQGIASGNEARSNPVDALEPYGDNLPVASDRSVAGRRFHGSRIQLGDIEVSDFASHPRVRSYGGK